MSRTSSGRGRWPTRAPRRRSPRRWRGSGRCTDSPIGTASWFPLGVRSMALAGSNGGVGVTPSRRVPDVPGTPPNPAATREPFPCLIPGPAEAETALSAALFGRPSGSVEAQQQADLPLDHARVTARVDDEDRRLAPEQLQDPADV